MYAPSFIADDTELDAQVSAEVSPRASQRHPEASLFDVQELRFQRDGIHRRDGLSKREGKRSSASTIHENDLPRFVKFINL